MFDLTAQNPIQPVRRKPTSEVAPVSRVRGVEGVGETTAAGPPTLEARAPAVLGPVYTFAQNMGLIQNRTLLIMQSKLIRDITQYRDMFDQEEVRKNFSNALVMVAAHSPEELEIFLLTTERMARGGHADRLSAFFSQVTEALTERLKRKDEDEDEETVGEMPFPMPHDPDDDLVAQVKHTITQRFDAARARAQAMGVMPGEQPSEKLAGILKAGEEIVKVADPAPEAVLDLLTVKR